MEERKDYLPVKILHDFAAKIEKLKVPYMLSGSMAMMNYSVYRFTADIDIVLELKQTDASRLIAVFEPEYYVPHNAVSRAISTERMFNIIHQETAFKIDCIIGKSTDFQKTAFERRQTVDFYGREIWIISKEDLIISKLWWAKDSHSDKQLNDVKNLIRQNDEIIYDVDYVEKWAKRLELTELLEECRKETEE